MIPQPRSSSDGFGGDSSGGGSGDDFQRQAVISKDQCGQWLPKVGC